MLNDLGERSEAEEQYRKGLAIQQKLAAEFPRRAGVPARAWPTATMAWELARPASGSCRRRRNSIRKALVIQEKLDGDFPALPVYRQDLANNHSSLGFLLFNLGKWPEAEVQYRRYVAIQQKLAAEFPAVPDYRKHLARSHNGLGVLLKASASEAGAGGAVSEGLAIEQKLAAEVPAVPDYRQNHSPQPTTAWGFCRPAQASCRRRSSNVGKP